MIISASRRTDIPAFYSEWFMNRIRDGALLVRNPRNANQVRRISLLSEDVDVIVFWTRNPKPLIPSLKELGQRKLRYYFQYTITAYPKLLDTHGPYPAQSIETFKGLSDLIGPEKVIWRYDPILISNYTNIAYHKDMFFRLASQLQGKTHRVVISFADLYKKTIGNLNKVSGLQYIDLLENKYQDLFFELIAHITQVAETFHMKVESCGESTSFAQFPIKHGKCIDDELIQKIFGIEVTNKKDRSQREACGCVKSIDIGRYDTCLHGCVYCYATNSRKVALKNYRLHNPESPFILGELREDEEMFLIPPKKQMTFL